MSDGLEQDVRNQVINGVQLYDKDIHVVDDLLKGVDGAFDCYMQVKISVSSSLGEEVKRFLTYGSFSINDSGKIGKIKIDRVFINKEKEKWDRCKTVWVAISFKTKKKLDLPSLLNEINNRFYSKYTKIFYYGISLQPQTTQFKKFCDLFLAITLKEK